MGGTPRVPGTQVGAAALLRLVRLHKDGMTQADLARRFGQRATWVADNLRRMAPSSSQVLRT